MDNQKAQAGLTASNTLAPPFLYGTAWKEDDTQRCVEEALSAGFRGIDTANQRKHYFEAGVGNALEKFFSQGALSRKDVFIQTKFTSMGGQDNRLPYDPNDPLHKQVEQSCASSLEHLHTDYLDSYVLHGPSTYRGFGLDDQEVWRAMEDLYDQRKVMHLGISNVTLEQLQIIYELARVKPSFVQNRCFASTRWDSEVRAYCAQNQIIYQGFSLLTANIEVFRNPRFLEIAHRARKTPAQIVFRFAIQVGMLPITGTTNPAHMREDLESLQFELSENDLRTIEGALI
ncbi:MAG: aldo/keto reductase [Bdellovibrionota bacterium]